MGKIKSMQQYGSSMQKRKLPTAATGMITPSCDSGYNNSDYVTPFVIVDGQPKTARKKRENLNHRLERE
jgi:hypothetical protein